ncbi:MAG: hypothetical protein RL375_3400 [Pseudomonadota bacterium]|jgi:hypothetical protein
MTSTKGRKPNPTPEAVADGTTTEILSAKGQSLDAISQQSLQIAQTYGDGTPYDRERLVGQARFFMGTSAEAYFEAGKCLVQIKENEPHGEWLGILEHRLRINVRTAQRMMQTAVKYVGAVSKASAPTLLELGRTKLLELMSESDADIEALADGGAIAGLDLDDMQTMSARELRDALKKARQEMAAKDRVIAAKNTKLDKIAEAEELRRNGSPDERESAQLGELRDAGLEAEQVLQRLTAVVDQVMQTPATEAAELAARQTVDYVVQRLADALLSRGISVDLMGERIDPTWAKAITEAAAAGQRGKKRA